MLDFESARERLAARVVALPPVRLPLAAAVGCRLAEAPRADTDVPAADVSAMDGFAVRAADTEAGEPLAVSLEVPAGALPGSLASRHAARIFTGGVLPAGADTIVPQEEVVSRSGDRVVLPRAPAGRFVRHAGEVCQAGSELLPCGARVTAQSIASLGAAGAHTVSVIPRPRVVVVTTGSELVPIEALPEPGQVRDGNLVMLESLAKRHRCDVILTERVGDAADRIREALRGAAQRADLILTCGGVSVGDYDFVPRILGELGAEQVFHKVAIQPGKPLLVARLGPVWVVGLPGNPMSALVGWRFFASPLCDALAGDTAAFAETPRQAVLTSPCGNAGWRLLFAPSRRETRDTKLAITPLSWRGSHDVTAMSTADSLIRVEAGRDYAVGDVVPYYLLD
jgi:molybdopterin molybdotransferase